MRVASRYRPVEKMRIDVTHEEMCFVQYLPIKLPEQGFAIPKNLSWTWPLVFRAFNDWVNTDSTSISDAEDSYIYLTVKRLWVNGNNVGNRTGWHIDGFMTEDVNYIWFNGAGTVVMDGVADIDEDHEKSMLQMGALSDKLRRVHAENNMLIKLTNQDIHSPPFYVHSHLRTFVKVSISKHKYNLKGNAHNYLLDYKWDMKDREISRNHPTKGD